MAVSEPGGVPDPSSQPLAASDARMRYLHAYSYVFDNPNWVMNVLLVTVCQLIPVIGPIVMTGYQFVLIESLYRQPRRNYPDFDFEKFVNYLGRGVWPFLVSLAAGMLFVPFFMIFFYGGMFAVFAGASAVGEEGGVVVAAICIPLLILGLFVIIAVLNLVVLPMILRAGLAQGFAEAFDLDFIKGFIARVWWEMILMVLFLMITSLLLAMVGMAFFCVGVYPAMTLVMLAQAHLYYQLYVLYLARGGKPIPLKQPPPEAPLVDATVV